MQSMAFIGPEAKIFCLVLPKLTCQVGGAVFGFVPKRAFSSGENAVCLFGGAIFALHNYLLIRQLRQKKPK